MDKKNVIMQSNRIVTGKQFFSTREKKLFIQLILNLNPLDEILEYEIDGDIFASAVGISTKHRRDEIKRLMESFQGKTCTIEEPDGSWQIYALCPKSRYDVSTSTIKLRLNDELRDDFIGLSKNFTRYYLEDVLSLQGFYSVRMYEIVKCLRNYETLSWESAIDIYDLKDMLLGAKSKKYSRVNDFIKKVIEPSVKEINEKTQLDVVMEQIRGGRGNGTKKIHFKIKEGLFPKDKQRQPSLAL